MTSIRDWLAPLVSLFLALFVPSAGAVEYQLSFYQLDHEGRCSAAEIDHIEADFLRINGRTQSDVVLRDAADLLKQLRETLSGDALDPMAPADLTPLPPLWPATEPMVDHWGLDDGLPSLEILGLSEGNGGLVAITANGIVALTGSRFEPVVGEQALRETSATPPDLSMVPDHQVRFGVVTAHRRDHLGDLWLGTKHRGVFRIRPRLFNSMQLDHPRFGRVWSVAEGKDQSLWMSTDGGLIQWRGSEIAFYAAPTDSNVPMRGPWVGKSGRVNANLVGRTLFWPPPSQDHPLILTVTPEIVRSPDYFDIHSAYLGTINPGAWLGTAHGVIRRDSSGTQRIGTEQGLSSLDVRAVVEGSDTSVWIATYGGGVSHYVDGAVRRTLTRIDGLPDDHAWSLHRNRVGIVWVGTAGGLARIDANDQVFAFTTRHGLPSNRVNQFLEDDQGRFWIGTARGIYCVALADLNAVAEGKQLDVTCQLFGPQDGLLNPHTTGGYQNGCFKTSDGRLCFATEHGVAFVDPKKWPLIANEPNRSAPPLLSTSPRQHDFKNRYQLSQYAFTKDAQVMPFDPARPEDTETLTYCGEPLSIDTVSTKDHLNQLRATVSNPESKIWVPPSLTPQPPILPPAPLLLDHWTARDGLPPGNIRALLQTRDGYLWIGTSFGLARFDGRRFTVFNEANTPAMVQTGEYCQALAEDAEGTLWIGTARGLLRMGDASFDRIADVDHRVPAIHVGANGAVWFGHHTVRKWQNGAITEYPFDDTISPQEIRITSIVEDASGTLYIAGRNRLFRMRSGSTDLIHTGFSSAKNITSVVADNVGRIWATNILNETLEVAPRRGDSRLSLKMLSIPSQPSTFAVIPRSMLPRLTAFYWHQMLENWCVLGAVIMSLFQALPQEPSQRHQPLLKIGKAISGLEPTSMVSTVPRRVQFGPSHFNATRNTPQFGRLSKLMTSLFGCPVHIHGRCDSSEAPP